MSTCWWQLWLRCVVAAWVAASSPGRPRHPAPGSRAPGSNFHFITAAAVICISSSSSSSRSSAQSSLSPDTSWCRHHVSLSQPQLTLHCRRKAINCASWSYCFISRTTLCTYWTEFCRLPATKDKGSPFLGDHLYCRQSIQWSQFPNVLLCWVSLRQWRSSGHINTWNLLFVTTNISLMTPLSNVGVIILGLFNLIYSTGRILSMVGRCRN